MTTGLRVHSGVVHLVDKDPERIGEGAKTVCCGRKIYSLNGNDAITDAPGRATCPAQTELGRIA